MKKILKDLILKKKLNQKKVKYGKRKLSVGVVSLILAFSIFTPSIFVKGAFENVVLKADEEKIEINIINFPDENFRKAIQEILKNKLNLNTLPTSITKEQIKNIKKLSITDNNPFKQNYERFNKIKGIEYFTELEELTISSKMYYDASFIKNLKKLKYLDLSGNSIKDTTFLKNLNNLKELNLSYNSISDFDTLNKMLEGKNITNLNLNRQYIHFAPITKIFKNPFIGNYENFTLKKNDNKDITYDTDKKEFTIDENLKNFTGYAYQMDFVYKFKNMDIEIAIQPATYGLMALEMVDKYIEEKTEEFYKNEKVTIDEVDKYFETFKRQALNEIIDNVEEYSKKFSAKDAIPKVKRKTNRVLNMNASENVEDLVCARVKEGAIKEIERATTKKNDEIIRLGIDLAEKHRLIQKLGDIRRQAEEDLKESMYNLDVEEIKNAVILEIEKIQPQNSKKKTLILKRPKRKIKVKDINKLTEKEKYALKKAIKDENKALNLLFAEIEVDEKGNVLVTKDDKEGKLEGKYLVEKETAPNINSGTSKNDNNGNTGSNSENNGKNKNVNTQKLEIKAPDKKIKVKDPNNLTKEEKEKIEKEIRNKNKDLPKDFKFEIDNVNIVVKDKDNKVVGKLKIKDIVEREVSKNKIKSKKENKKSKLPKTSIASSSIISASISLLGVILSKKKR